MDLATPGVDNIYPEAGSARPWCLQQKNKKKKKKGGMANEREPLVSPRNSMVQGNSHFEMQHCTHRLSGVLITRIPGACNVLTYKKKL